MCHCERSEAIPLLPSNIKALVLDMDGVLWTENRPIGDLSTIFAAITRRGLKVALATNNSTKTPEQYLARLRGFGVTGLEDWQIVTSSQALAHVLTEQFPSPFMEEGLGVRAEIFTIGETGLIEALREHGFTPITDADYAGTPLAVVLGMDRSLDFAKLRRAALLIRRGIPFYATNPDRTFPTPEGLIPGCGTLIAALETATDVKPIVVGKPAAYMLQLALEQLGTKPAETLVVGDRLETDIAAAQVAGCRTALVLSGVSTSAMGKAWRPAIEVIAADLSELLSPLLSVSSIGS